MRDVAAGGKIPHRRSHGAAVNYGVIYFGRFVYHGKHDVTAMSPLGQGGGIVDMPEERDAQWAEEAEPPSADTLDSP